MEANGCSGVQLDDDNDGVHNLNDLCPATPLGEIVSSTGCTVQTEEKTKSQEDIETSSSSLTWILFVIAGVLVVVALIVTFRPQKPLPAKSVPSVKPESTVDDGGSQGDSSATSADLGSASLDVDTSQAQLVTDEN